MGWKVEAREVTQLHYSGYCQMCKKIGETPVPYHSFDDQEYHRVRRIAKPKAYGIL